MSKTETETVIIKQTVHRPHNETVVRRWYDVVEITLRRDVDPNGYVVWQEEEEEVTDWEVDLEEETLDTDVDAGDDEVVEESYVYGLCRKLCSGGDEGAVAPVCVGIKQRGSRTVWPP